MSDYVVGDIQGCLDELQSLLTQVAFDPTVDRLWLTGDLVARGPKSLETLRFIKSLGSSARTVLGNHDLHLIATHMGIKRVKTKDRLNELLTAPDVDELIQWLLQQPLLRMINDRSVLTHAGLSPQWDITTAQRLAKEVESQLQSERASAHLSHMYQNTPNIWNENLCGYQRFRYIINSFTRMRFCLPDGSFEFDSKCAPHATDNPLLQPWYRLKPRSWSQHTLFFGHWASLMGKTDDPSIIALDTGCVWGNHLTLYRIADQKIFTMAALTENVV